jgi:tetratricopeptide (TPR) repeat protein
VITTLECLLLPAILVAAPPVARVQPAPSGRACSEAELTVGRSLLLLGRPDEARRVFSHLRGQYPEDPAVYFGLVTSLLELKEYEAAEYLLTSCPWPEREEALQAQVRIFTETGRLDQAASLRRERLGEGSNAALALAECEHRRGRWDRALRLYQEFLEANPRGAEDHPEIRTEVKDILLAHKPRAAFRFKDAFQARSASIAHLVTEGAGQWSRDLRLRAAIDQTIAHRPRADGVLRPLNESVTAGAVGLRWEPRPAVRYETGVRGYAGGLETASVYGTVRWEPAERTEIEARGDLFRLSEEVVDFLALEGTYHEAALSVYQEGLVIGFVRARGFVRRYNYAESRAFARARGVTADVGLVVRPQPLTARIGYTFHYFHADREDDLALGDFSDLFLDGVPAPERQAHLAGLIPGRITTHGALAELEGQTRWETIAWALEAGYRYDRVPGEHYWNVGGGLRYAPITSFRLDVRCDHYSEDPRKGGGATTECVFQVNWWF